MRISYSILWFDDDQDYLDSLDLEELNEAITSWGFVPQITLVSNPDEFMQHAPFKAFDLVAMDYNLEEFGEHGQTFIKQIRNHDVYTEVVFYSANKVSDLWKAIETEKLEGFVSKSLKIIEAQVVWATRYEMAKTVEDVLARRTRSLFLNAKESVTIAPRVASLMANELGHDKTWETAQVAEFKEIAKNYILN